jgi:phosphorylase kinase alpha/beta subunit
MPKQNYDKIIQKHLEILKSLQQDSGLFLASSKNVATGYDKSWLRDNFYETIAFEVMGEWETVEKTYDAILNIFLKHEEKIDWAIEHKPLESWQYIHARFHPTTFDEFWESWGNKQNDAVGCILYRIGELEVVEKRSVLEDKDRVRIVNKLVKYLNSVEYWHDKDSGVWEEAEELHASSVGACVAGLKSVARLPQIEVPQDLITKGEQALRKLLPRESDTKFVDLALLSLIWPYNVTTKQERNKILVNVEYHLRRKRGVIRYKGDRYYNANEDGLSEEAEWTFGLAWLAIIYQNIGLHDRAKQLVNEMLKVDTKQGIPELYFSNSTNYNENTPLGWSESLFIVALHNTYRK